MRLLFIFCLTLTLSFADYYSNRVLLSDVQTLTLRSDRQTTGRRTAPIPQVKCVGGSAQCRFVPDVIQCRNVGSDGVDVQWECKADMEDIYRFGTTEVICEGYSSPDDEYILKGSCGVEFTLDYTDKGRKYAANQDTRKTASYTYGADYDSDSGSSTFVGRLITLGVCLALLYAIYLFCQQGGFRSNNGGGGGSGPYWGGGGGGYSPYYGQQGCAPTYSVPQTGGGGGFWTGAATGSLLGYLLGRRNTGYYNSGYYSPNYYSAGPTHYSSGPSFSTSSSSAPATRTASAFASTRRR